MFHQGACSDTMESDGRYMMQNNFEYSKRLLEWCQANKVPLIYASSASVYGAGPEFREERRCEKPLNVYGYSKFLFDQLVRQRLPASKAQIAGFRYFNVYGPNEAHKGRMASVAYHAYHQLLGSGKVKLFVGSGGYGNGEQRRDFVYVDDVVDVNLWFLEHRNVSGVYNCGTGRAQSFNELAGAVINAVQGTRRSIREMAEKSLIEYVPFPPGLLDKYQSFTEADLTQAARRRLYGGVQAGGRRRRRVRRATCRRNEAHASKTSSATRRWCGCSVSARPTRILFWRSWKATIRPAR